MRQLLLAAGLLLPLSLDTFALAAALGVAGLERRDRLRVTLVFTVFEAGMPIVGLLAGRLVGGLMGAWAGYGGLSVVLTVIWIAVQAFVAAQVGLRFGARVGEALRERSEQAAGLALIVVALVLLGLRIANL